MRAETELQRRSAPGHAPASAAGPGGGGGGGGGGGPLPRLLLGLAVLVGSGIATVWEHVRATRAGYRLHALEVEREKLREERRRLEAKRAREERLEALEDRARRLGIAIPGEAPEPGTVGG